jgi:hypothetical protein
MLVAWKNEIELEQTATERVRFLCSCEARVNEPRRGDAEGPSITRSCATNLAQPHLQTESCHFLYLSYFCNTLFSCTRRNTEKMRKSR